MFSPALVCVCVCVSVCLSVTTITKKIVDGFAPNFMRRFLGGKGRPSSCFVNMVEGCGSNGQKIHKPAIVCKIAPSGNSELEGRKIVSVASVAKCWRQKRFHRDLYSLKSTFHLVAHEFNWLTTPNELPLLNCKTGFNHHAIIHKFIIHCDSLKSNKCILRLGMHRSKLSIIIFIIRKCLCTKHVYNYYIAYCRKFKSNEDFRLKIKTLMFILQTSLRQNQSQVQRQCYFHNTQYSTNCQQVVSIIDWNCAVSLPWSAW